jgi:hypothetical protein
VERQERRERVVARERRERRRHTLVRVGHL